MNKAEWFGVLVAVFAAAVSTLNACDTRKGMKEAHSLAVESRLDFLQFKALDICSQARGAFEEAERAFHTHYELNKRESHDKLFSHIEFDSKYRLYRTELATLNDMVAAIGLKGYEISAAERYTCEEMKSKKDKCNIDSSVLITKRIHPKHAEVTEAVYISTITGWKLRQISTLREVCKELYATILPK